MDGSPDLPAGYPRAWEADIVLSDGSVALVRPILPSDAEGLHRFHAGQSAESIYLRFFAPLPRISDKDVRRFTHVDYRSRVALVVLVRDDIAGIGRFDQLDEQEHSAEVAFNVADAHRGRGIGSVLLEHLADIGSSVGVRRFVAEVLPQNRRMLGVFQEAGFEVSHEYDDGLIAVSFDIEPTDRSRAVRLSREHRAEGRSMRAVLQPASVVVVGVSRTEGAIGSLVLRHITESGYSGQVHAVGRAAAGTSVSGVEVVASLTDIDSVADLVVIAVPASGVLEVVRECGQAGSKAVLIVSSDFADADTDQGRILQGDVLAVARASGMRLLGPNSFGLINARDRNRLNASLSPRMPPVGSFGMFAQSGALGIALLASAERRDVGISTFVSAGNRSDISGNDLMQYWLDDDATTAVGMYLESMGNPRKFTRIARELASIKPVIVVKSGFSESQVTPGHAVRETHERPEAFAAMLRQSGVIRVENTHQMFDVAQLVTHHPLPAGPRVAIVTNAPALGSLAADACVSWNLDIVGESVSGRSFESSHQGGDHDQFGNTARSETVHATGRAGFGAPPQFGAAVAAALDDPGVDSVVACFVPSLADGDPAIAQAVAAEVAKRAKPCVATFLGMRGTQHGLPTYSMPEDAVRALAEVTRYAQWKARDRGPRVSVPRINRRTAHDVIESHLSTNPAGGDLSHDQAQILLSAYDIELWPLYPVSSPAQAREQAQKIGGPVVVKATARELRHEPGRRWVRTDLGSPQACATAFANLRAALAERGLGHGETAQIAVQPCAPSGTAVTVSGSEDPLFGPVVTFGVAGVPTELLGDVAHRFPPLRTGDIEDMVSGIQSAPLLQGYRGAEPVDHAALHDLIARVSVLADDHPEVASMTLNPVIAHDQGVAVLGAKIRLVRAQARSDTNRRTLSR